MLRLSWVFINTEPERGHCRIDLTHQFPIVTFELASGEQNVELQEESIRLGELVVVISHPLDIIADKGK